jgi:hypothetical protein
LTPGLWADWFALLTSSTGSSTVPGSIPVPLVLRLPFAVVVILHAARTGRSWLLPFGVLLAMPVIWWGSLAILTAAAALRREAIEARLDELLVAVEDWHGERLATRRAASSSESGA